MTLDTNILIAYFDKEASVVKTLDELRAHGTTFILPAVVEMEILSFPGWNSEERLTVEQFLEENFIFIPFDRTIVRSAADIRRRGKIKFADASIAATALFTNTPLVTRNTRDFNRIPTLQLVTM